MLRLLLILALPLSVIAQDWTVLVYMAADNDLASLADLDLAEMETVGSTDDVTIVVQVDKPNIGARRLLVREQTSTVLQELGIIDMCDWKTLADFLEWGIRSYPAQRYFVVLWDHGSGWTLAPQRAFGSDWSSGNQLGIANGEFRQALETAYNSTGEKIGLFSFDACLMQQLEVAYEIKEYARVFLAPQTICPLRGFQYDSILQTLTADPTMGSHTLAQKAVAFNVSSYIDSQPVVFSAVNLGHLFWFKEALHDVTASLMAQSPSQDIHDLRLHVQTLPALGTTPDPNDTYIDIGDFCAGLYALRADSLTAHLLGTYNTMIVASGYWGEQFSRTTGLSVWFPPRYVQFKQLIDYYAGLTWTESPWLQFLNWFYDQDDIRPTDVRLCADTGREDNNFSLSWQTSHDLTPVTYGVIEAEDTILLFNDGCEDSSQWNVQGFTLTPDNAYSGTYSFFSGNASNLQNFMETKQPLSIDTYGLVRIYLYYNTEEITDSLIIEYGEFKDIHYGFSDGWQERRTVVPPGHYPLTISYHTNDAINLGGCYIDDIKIHELVHGRTIQQYYPDTSLFIFNKLKGDYLYMVFGRDAYNNSSNLSNSVAVSVDNYALPYSNPNPFQTSCDIVLDYPDTLQPTVTIFSISAQRVRAFGAHEIHNNTVHWDGRDEQGREVGSGLYFVLVKDGAFKRIGKIARQR
jgi:hypothetical protein